MMVGRSIRGVAVAVVVEGVRGIAVIMLKGLYMRVRGIAVIMLKGLYMRVPGPEGHLQNALDQMHATLPTLFILARHCPLYSSSH